MVVADQPQSQLVMRIEPGLPDLAVQHRDPPDRLATVRAAALLAGERPLCPAKAPLRLAEVARVVDDLPVGGDHEPARPEINPHLARARRERLLVAFDDERHVVPPVRLADHRAGRRRAPGRCRER